MGDLATQAFAFVFGALVMAAATIVVTGFVIRWRREGESVVGVIDVRRAWRVLWGTLIAGGVVILGILAVFGMPILIRAASLQLGS
jgi:hypothetical protein